VARTQAHTRAIITAFTEEIEKQTDRGAGIVAAAVLEDALTLTIEIRLLELSSDRRDRLFGRMGPLSNFSAKIELGFALGLFSNEGRKAFDMIRDVRNKFAHEVNISSFDDPRIAGLVKKGETEQSPKNLTPRESFIKMFMASIALMYLEQTADIRLKSLGETHQDLFIQAVLVAAKIQSN
jgi:hypothetical protein